MPEISRFFGIIIKMYFGDHDPPHFHVGYNEFRAIVDIDRLGVINGYLPPRVLGLVIEWAEVHQQELKTNCETIKISGTFSKIEPLV